MTLNNNPLGPRSGHCTVLHAATLITAPVAKMTTIPAAGAVSNANTQLTQRGTRLRCSPCGARSVSPVDTVIAFLPSTAGMRHCARSEEHTSELQSRGHIVCRLLLEKKKTNNRSTLC